MEIGHNIGSAIKAMKDRLDAMDKDAARCYRTGNVSGMRKVERELRHIALLAKNAKKESVQIRKIAVEAKALVRGKKTAIGN